MLETNVNNFSEENKYHAYLKTETKRDGIREEIEDSTIRRISVQIKSLTSHAEKYKEKLNYVLREANDAKLAHKEEKYQVLDVQEHMDKKILKLSTLKSFAHLNIQQLQE